MRKRQRSFIRRMNRWIRVEILAACALMIAVMAGWWITERRETEAEANYLLSDNIGFDIQPFPKPFLRMPVRCTGNAVARTLLFHAL